MVRIASFYVCSLVGLVACGDSTTPQVSRIAPAAGLAVVNSDYVSTSISLIDATSGEVANPDCIDSGTRAPGATLALSGDVVLPSQAQSDGLLVAIDRTNSALTWIEPTMCAPLRQLDVSTGFYANPHDAIGVSSTKAYVTRYERNAVPTANPADFDEGDDVLIVDPSVPAITGRIDLSSYAIAVAGATMQARPDRALLVGTTLYVALGELSDDFMTAATGRLVAIDTTTDRVTATIDLAGVTSCTGLSYVAASQVLVVACAGTFSDADQAATSAIISLDLTASPPVERHRQTVAAFGGSAIAGYSGAASAGALGFGVTYGVLGGAPDSFWVLDAAAGTATKLADASDSFVFGSVLVDAERSIVYLTDADPAAPRVQIYSYATTPPSHEAAIEADPALGLPPREIERY